MRQVGNIKNAFLLFFVALFFFTLIPFQPTQAAAVTFDLRFLWSGNQSGVIWESLSEEKLTLLAEKGSIRPTGVATPSAILLKDIPGYSIAASGGPALSGILNPVFDIPNADSYDNIPDNLSMDIYIGEQRIGSLTRNDASKSFDSLNDQGAIVANFLNNISEDEVEVIDDGGEVSDDGTNVGTGSDDLGSANEQRGGCESNAINIPLSLIICPLVEIMFDAIDGLYKNFIIPQLIISPLDNSPDAPDDSRALYSVWNSFRVVANILFIFIFLIAIIGQAFSWFFTPYELKKILPRLAIGVIGAQLSWYITGFFIDVFNIIGGGVRALMLAPLDGLDSNLNLNFDVIDNVISGVATGLGTGAVLFTIGIGGLLWGLPLILFPIIMALLATYVTVLLRKILIFLLVITSPIAFILWILPGTESIFKSWWGFFWKALFVYPVIVALISAGEFMGRTITASENAGGSPSISQSIVGLIALFGPYFVIPTAFRLAGGVLAGVSGSMDGFAKGASNRLFGDARDGESYRGKRLSRLRSKRTTRRLNLAEGYVKNPFTKNNINIAGNSENGGSGYHRAFNKTVATALPNIYDEVAERFQDSLKELDTVVSNGPDDVYFATLARMNGYDETNHPYKDQNISPQAWAAVNSIWDDTRGNKAKAQAALIYTLGKTSSEEQVDDLRKGFAENDTLGFSESERENIFSVAANHERVQQSMLGLKHTDLQTGRINGSGNQRDFISQLNRGNQGGGRLGSQKSVTWKQTGEVIDDVLTRTAGAELGIDTANWQDRKNSPEMQRVAARVAEYRQAPDQLFANASAGDQQTLSELSLLTRGMDRDQTINGTPAAEKARYDMLTQEQGWLTEYGNLERAAGRNGS